MLRASSLFDADWYLRTYADVAGAGVDPTAHFLDAGWREGRDPSPMFATSAYLRANSDVASAGINPLIHFIEFGRFEGRATFGSRHLDDAPTTALEDFPPAAEVVSYDIAPRLQLTWRRSVGFDFDAAGLITVGKVAAGCARNRQERIAVELVVRTFHALVDTSVALDRLDFKELNPPDLQDAWHGHSHLLRTRWRCTGEPFGVRIFQHDPAEKSVVLVGEGAIECDLDVVDARLRQAFFPLLYIFTTLGGIVTGVRVAAFPSLCRGGEHYAEAVHRASTKGRYGVDPIADGELLGVQMLATRGGNARTGIGDLSVNLEGSSGSTTLFRTDFRLWLKRVAGVGVSASATADSPVAQFLVEAASVAPPGARAGGTTLGLRHDMIPTIAALAASGADETREGVLPFLITSDDPAVPATWVSHPEGLPSSLTVLGPTARSWSGNKRRGIGSAPAWAILRGRALSDAELLMPSWQEVELDRERPPVCWILPLDRAGPGQVNDTVRALRLQKGSAGDQLVLVGTGTAMQLAAAHDGFGDGLSMAADIQTAARGAGTTMIGLIAPGVVLHDQRTATILSGVLCEQNVASASCAAVRLAEQGSSWRVSIADGGDLAMVDGGGPALCKRAVTQLWGTDYAVYRPSPYLWLARSSMVERWLGAAADHGAKARFHVFSARTACTLEGIELPIDENWIASADEADVTTIGLSFG